MDEPIAPQPADDVAPLPEDLAALSAEELVELDTRITAAFDELFDAGDPDAEAVARLEALAGQMEAVRGEHDRRTQEAEQNAAAAAEIAARVRPPAEPEPEAVETPAEPEAVEVAAELAEPVAAQAAEPAAVPAPAEPIAAAARQTEPAQPRRRPRLNMPLSLGAIAANAPAVTVEPSAPRREVVITAAADVPGFAVGGRIADRDAIAAAAWGRARHLPVTANPSNADGWSGQGGVPVATIERSHDLVISGDTSPEQIEELLRPLRDPAVLVAAGGWCAPSTPLYEFFNISAADGLLDLPTVGVTRGGLRWPTSPTLADVLENVWLWTETNDILAVTGTGTKPCARVPCPDYNEARLAAHGICVTAGNLTDAAFPESTRNFIKLLLDAHKHVMNARHIADAVAAAGAEIAVTSPADGAAANLLAAVELQAVDYREKFGMSDNSVLETVLPRWTHGVVRADLSRRNGVDLLSVSDEEIAGWFDDRQVRAQFVADYQTRAAGFPGQAAALVAWPATVNFLLYAAGTLVQGEGPTIDLGVTRDSILNAKNDHTAAWTEETSFVAKFGHEVRNVEVAICPDGVTGAQVNTACPVA